MYLFKKHFYYHCTNGAVVYGLNSILTCLSASIPFFSLSVSVSQLDWFIFRSHKFLTFGWCMLRASQIVTDIWVGLEVDMDSMWLTSKINLRSFW